jgi:hypothetical protein
MEDELDMEVELERELAAEQEELLEEEEDELGLQHALEMALDHEKQQQQQQVKKPLSKVLSLPANFTFSSPCGGLDTQEGSCNCEVWGVHGSRHKDLPSSRTVFLNHCAIAR